MDDRVIAVPYSDFADLCRKAEQRDAAVRWAKAIPYFSSRTEFFAVIGENEEEGEKEDG